MTNKTPIVAIVGRANVGKSSLYNAILARREAIVAREAGTTRDSLMAKASWHNQEFWIVDTAGIKDPEDQFEFTIQEQILQAAESADVIWVIVEADIQITEEERKLADLALKTKKPVFLVINKIDQVKDKTTIDHFRHVGIKDYVLISVTQGKGIDDLLNQTLAVMPKVAFKKQDPGRLKLVIIGRPNVGKSQLFNTLADKQQALVSERAGTTRDVNRTEIKYHSETIEILDTAGIRRPGKVEVGVEKFSVLRSLSAIEEADVCLLLIDSNELNVQLDQKLAGLVKEAGKGLILVVSKWDIVSDKDPFTRDKIAAGLARTFDFVAWAPLIFTSSVTGQNVTKIFDLASEVVKNRSRKVATKDLNKWLEQVVSDHPPAGLKNRNPKLNYIVQEMDNATPAFKIFGSSTKFVHWSYRRYLEKNLRLKFGFDGSAIEIWFIEKHVAHKHGNSPTKAPREVKPLA